MNRTRISSPSLEDKWRAVPSVWFHGLKGAGSSFDGSESTDDLTSVVSAERLTGFKRPLHQVPLAPPPNGFAS